ncbi:MAG: DNA-formamidopyrimidine glycosylase [Candidatus Phytoplasma stylosanthis]|uniref:DNA-formamidopyrimidine glycosylase n=1 Tax=Candidatus Phytoplasma stylosanthis TaxID=2798314 RepID=UPI002939B4E2|nr:DNA-formamidopyrimidine glycosylase [Candidatus Phytoplasma stylosanthis]MDV3167997.1 DNA-formamidopyrimidine glycosylase [Candidatus Phytoplasma stylosanthis]MDV3171067.1 DNA-formamidopyrimidine glycosylase [Candidatus Phytoplasma stylosanthis]MDV3173854.1 DNA-formamidopyrimidine glycosylase [Candidatus Phytoplasma stylosanthis]MDV3174271.1 DNA-formamidopyrimidine glycosylase [Candidatus Phytoplasma stylosanthis]MDV3202615.1 DNA-formamidopyrimidine glycosylase [Candidatus Phytoplasma stylo
MPELPEVEVTIRILRKKIIGETIKKINVFYPPSFKSSYSLENIKGKKILDIQRKGKFLIFFLDQDWVLVGHFRMEGKVYINSLKECDQIHKHENFRILLASEKVFRYYDFRKFGSFSLYKKKNYLEESGLNKIALDPFLINAYDFFNQVNKKKIFIKKILLNQRIISGIGNIYASEILFLSKIHPETFSNNLTFQHIQSILKISKKVLKRAIQYGGSSFSSFEALGQKGHFQKKLLVYKKDKKNCSLCNYPIQKKKIEGRSSYFCLKCQKIIS